MASLYSRVKTWISGEVLTASDQNAEHDNHITNNSADKVEGSSANVAAMQIVVDPGEVSSESLASSVDGEIKRLRSIVKEITGQAQWYETPGNSLIAQGVVTTNPQASVDPDMTDKSVLILDNSGEIITLTGIQGGVTGQVLYVLTTGTGFDAIVANNGAGTQKILTHKGSDITIDDTFRGGIVMVFNGTNWIVLDFQKDQTDFRKSIGQQVSSSSGVFNTTSTSFVDVTNLSVTITTTGRPVMLMFTPDGVSVSLPGQLRGVVNSGTTNVNVNFNIRRDSTDIATTAYAELRNTGNEGSNIICPPGFLNHIDVIAAGTYTYKLQAKVSVTTASAIVEKIVLTAFEL